MSLSTLRVANFHFLLLFFKPNDKLDGQWADAIPVSCFSLPALQIPTFCEYAMSPHSFFCFVLIFLPCLNMNLISLPWLVVWCLLLIASSYAGSFSLNTLPAGAEKEAESAWFLQWEAKSFRGPLGRDVDNLEQIWSAVGTLSHKAQSCSCQPSQLCKSCTS